MAPAQPPDPVNSRATLDRDPTSRIRELEARVAELESKLAGTERAPQPALQRSLRRFELLAQTASELLQSPDPQKTLESLCRKVMVHLDCHACFNFLVDERAGRLRLNACAGIPTEQARQIEWLNFGASVSGCTARDRCSIVAENLSTSQDERTQLVRSFGIKAYACHPLLGPGGKVIGTLSFGTRNRETFSADDLSLMKAVADQVTTAMIRMVGEQALRQSEALYRTIARNIPDAAVWVVDPDLHCLVVDGSIAAKLGLVRERMEGRTIRETIDEQLRQLSEEQFLRALAGESSSFESEYGDRMLWSQYVPLREESGQVVAAMALVQDITERKRDEEGLQRALAEAEEGRRILERLEAELREADRRKNEFLAVLSHELRNPLTPIKNSLYVLDHAPTGGKQANRAKEVIDRQVKQLTRLVDDLLDATRISKNKIQLQQESLELNELVQRTLEDHRTLFEDGEVHLEASFAPVPVMVNADGMRLAQVIGNLLQNAIKFTDRGGTTRVLVSSDTRANRAIIRITDTGVGIAPDMLLRVFQPFMQADTSLDRSKGGLGLGLALAKGLIELHGGSIQARSEGLGRGTTIQVQLPLAETASLESHAIQDDACFRGRRVLIIEDNVDAADSLREVLAIHQHEVLVAYSGPEGLALARDFNPEILLCDIGLPGMDGYEVARRFRADDKLRSVYLVALSGYALAEDLQKAIQAGFVRHLAKPPSLAQVQEILATAPQIPQQPSSAPTTPSLA